MKAIPDKDGVMHPLNRPEDFYLRGAVNVATVGGSAVSDASDDDLDVSGVARIRSQLESTLKPDEWRKAAAIFTKGGRYENKDKSYKGEQSAHPFGQTYAGL